MATPEGDFIRQEIKFLREDIQAAVGDIIFVLISQLDLTDSQIEMLQSAEMAMADQG